MQVVILAGGRGTRLSEETVVKPKPMVKIGEKPILWHIMNTYSFHGVNDFVVALGYKGEVIKDYFLNYHSHLSDLHINLNSGLVEHENSLSEDWTIRLVDTGTPTMTGGRLKRLQSVLTPNETFMLTYGDGVGNINIEELMAFHKSHGKSATLTAVRPPARFGSLVFGNSDQQITEFEEKPQTGEGWINGGFFVFEPRIFDYLEDDTTILERSPLETLARDGELMAYHHPDFWMPMDTVRDRDYLNEIWNNGNAPWRCPSSQGHTQGSQSSSLAPTDKATQVDSEFPHPALLQASS